MIKKILVTMSVFSKSSKKLKFGKYLESEHESDIEKFSVAQRIHVHDLKKSK